LATNRKVTEAERQSLLNELIDGDTRLHLYTYYGGISFQVLSIFLAITFLLATIPLTNLPKAPMDVSYWRVWAFPFDMASEVFGLAIGLSGMGYFFRNRRLAVLCGSEALERKSC
jgi:hypothetical protein